ncbi:MAG: Amuc_1099 family pilus-like system protein, partial [Luteolibacter sp.]
MSWLSKNYEKAALIAAAVVATGLAYLGWSKHRSVDSDFAAALRGTGKNETAVQNADAVPKALQSLEIQRKWEQAKDGTRPVDLFTGIPLFVSSNDPEKPVDLLKDEPIHPPIDNTWWIQHRIDPGFGDSPQRDPDGDGFSNIEEFTASTDPNNAKIHPPLIAKLRYIGDDSLTWVLRPGYGSQGKFPIQYEDSERRTNRVRSAEMVGAGELFFDEEPMKNRFKLLGSEIRKELNPRTKIEVETTIVRIEDQRTNKKGMVYEFPSPLSNDARKNLYLQYDRSAVLDLEALGLAGQEFKVEENTRFALPPDAPEKLYLLKSV